MQVVQVDDVPLEDRPGKARNGSWKRRAILRGEPDSIGDFVFTMLYEDGSKSTPRHRHNFDQFRYQLEGQVDFGPSGGMDAGVLGYFPEGAYYGPTTAPNPNISVALQFGGPSGSGYLTAEAHEAAHKALKALGVFENGTFRRNPGVPGKKLQDGFEAAWEYARQRPVVYPRPQYTNPILIDSEAFPWVPMEGVPGVSERALGAFTHCRIRAARYRVEPEASLVAPGRGVYLVLSGIGSVDGQNFRDLTTVYLDEGEQAEFEADTATDILLLGMPSVALMIKQQSRSGALQAAE